MEYFLLVGIILIAWIFNLFVALILRVYSGGTAELYERKIGDNGSNIFIYGLLGVGGLFLGNTFGGWSTYIIFVIQAILVLIGLIPFVIAIITNIIALFIKGDRGVTGRGKLADWIFLLSMFAENGIPIYILHKMFTNFF